MALLNACIARSDAQMQPVNRVQIAKNIALVNSRIAATALSYYQGKQILYPGDMSNASEKHTEAQNFGFKKHVRGSSYIYRGAHK